MVSSITPMKLLLTIFLLLLSTVMWAQNLVPNGNFESLSSCPTQFAQTHLAPPWIQYTGGTTDFLHTCGNGRVVVPTSYFGYQMPASGDGYGGLYAFAGNVPPDSVPASWSEYIASPITPMTVGETYEVSMSVVLTEVSKFACDGLGIFLFDVDPATSVIKNTSSTLPFKPQVHFDSYGLITDTQSWLRLSSLFYADSAYDNIVIGMYLPSNGLKTVSVNGRDHGSYYFIDSVVIKLPELYLSLADIAYCAGDSFDVQYTVSSPYFSGNIFTVQLSDPTGSFSSGTMDIGTKAANNSGSIRCHIPMSIVPGTKYRMRVLSSKPAITSEPNKNNITIGVHPRDIIASATTPVCEGDNVKLNVNSSIPDVVFTWVGPDGFSSVGSAIDITNVQTANAGKFYVTASVLGCKIKDSVEIVVNSYPIVNIGDDSLVCIHDSLFLSAFTDVPEAVFEWKGPNGFVGSTKRVTIPDFNKDNVGTYSVVVDNMGCKSSADINLEIVEVQLNISNDTVLCLNEKMLLKADVISVASPTYFWQDGSSNSEYFVSDSGAFYVIVSTVCGLYSDTVNIGYENCYCDPFVPNAFTPNNDGLNDKIGPILNCRVTDIYKFIIVNRFGEVVFKSTTPGEKWDGIYKATRAEVGTYFYLLQLTGPRSKDFQFKGDIILIR